MDKLSLLKQRYSYDWIIRPATYRPWWLLWIIPLVERDRYGWEMWWVQRHGKYAASKKSIVRHYPMAEQWLKENGFKR